MPSENLSLTCMINLTYTIYLCWDPKVPQKFRKSHWCVPFTATFSKRRKIGALWSERCDTFVRDDIWGCESLHLHHGVWYDTIYIYGFANIASVETCSFIKLLALHWFIFIVFHACYPKGCAAPGFVPCQCNTRGPLSKLERTPPQRKINVTSKSPVGDISVVTLIRTDTTLDHSQKAEKVCQSQAGLGHPITQLNHPCVWQVFFINFGSLQVYPEVTSLLTFCWEYPISCCPVGAGWWSALELSKSCRTCGWSSPTKQVVCKDTTV